MSIFTGYYELDSIIGELAPGSLTVIAGRPCMGKTTLCWSIAENIAQSGGVVGVVAYKEGYVGSDKTSLVRTYNFTSYTPIDELLENINLGNRKHDVLIFTTLHPAGRKEANELYSSLKAFAAAENIAVVVESAVVREVERTETRRPDKEHLKYSKTIDKYIDNLLFVYRKGYYFEDADASTFEVIVAESSSGKTGTAILGFEVDEIPTTLLVPRIKNRK